MEYKRHLFEFGVYWDRKILNIATDCQSQYNVLPVSFSILKPLVFEPGKVHPSDGAWTFRYKFTRCGKAITYNALALARPGKKPRLSALAPGDTRTSPQLLQDVFNNGVAAIVALKGEDKACQSTRVLNTRITRQPATFTIGGQEQKGVWEEDWLVKHCDEELVMTFCFVPDGKGGTSWAAQRCENNHDAE
jgi:hypothetical protein